MLTKSSSSSSRPHSSGVRRCSIYMFRFSGSFIILIGLKSSIPPISSICTLFRCPSFSWWCRDPDPCARWVCVVLSFGLVGGHPPCGPHGFWFTPFVHFCTRDPERHWSALHTCQPSDPMFKSYRIRFSLLLLRLTPTRRSYPKPKTLNGEKWIEPA